VVGLDRNPGLHRFRRHPAGLGRRALVCDSYSDFVRDYGLAPRFRHSVSSIKWVEFILITRQFKN